MGQQETRRQIREHERAAELLRANPEPHEAAERERLAGRHDFHAGTLRENLAAEVQAERAQLVQARDNDLVTVRWLRDGPPEGAWIDGRRYQGRGPVRQRLGQPPTHTAARAGEVEVQPGEVVELPRQHAEALVDSGYVEVTG